MGKEKILLVEDEKNIAKLIKYNLDKSGFKSECVYTGEAALEYLDKNSVDLIILDIMLPGMDGLEVCKKIKQEKELAAIPIIMLTAKGEEIDRIVGLELGADDYIVKPFSPRELILRIKAILRRSASEDEQQNVKIGEVTVDIPRHKVTVSGKEVEMTPMEFKLLLTLMRRKGRVQSRDRLLNDVWDISADVNTRTVDTHIKRLREKIGRAGIKIKTVRGLGYKFDEE
jgi:phosphate regulon transcriptional regulator PhoB